MVIPANNEVNSIGQIVRSCRKYCEEVIVVDDGSTDGTSTEAEKAGAIVLRNDSRLGVVRSLACGFKVARGDIIVTLDADEQHNTSEIGALVEPIVEGKDVRVECKDVGSGFRAVRAELARRMQLWGMCLCGSFVLEAYKCGGRIVEVRITVEARKHGRSHWSTFSRALAHGKQLFLLIPRVLT